MRPHLLSLFVLALPYWANAQQEKKNVLFIFIDDLRPALGCYGDSFAITPNLDAFAEKSFLFERAYCQQALSGPSRASLLTGLRPDEIEVTDLETHFRSKHPDIVTLPQLFKHNGYESIGIGKVFHGSRRTQDTISWSSPPLYNLSIKKEEYTLPENRHGKKAAAIEIAERPNMDFRDGQVTVEALRRLDTLASRQQPFFLAVGYIKPHLPFSMPKRFWNLYNEKDLVIADPQVEERPQGTPSLAFHNWQELRGYTDIPAQGPLSSAKKKELRKAYYACISFIDEQVGALLSRLRTLGLERNTIVVIVGDNGFHLNEQDIWGKSTNFELDCAVPLLIYTPEHWRKSRRLPQIVELLDLYPTLVDLCGLTPLHKLSGRTLRPLFEGRDSWNNIAFSQFPRPYAAISNAMRQTHMGYTVRTPEWRYTAWYNLATQSLQFSELYRMMGTSIERENLSGLPAYRSIERELQTMIENYRKQH